MSISWTSITFLSFQFSWKRIVLRRYKKICDTNFIKKLNEAKYSEKRFDWKLNKNKSTVWWNLIKNWIKKQISAGIHTENSTNTSNLSILSPKYIQHPEINLSKLNLSSSPSDYTNFLLKPVPVNRLIPAGLINRHRSASDTASTATGSCTIPLPSRRIHLHKYCRSTPEDTRRIHAGEFYGAIHDASFLR